LPNILLVNINYIAIHPSYVAIFSLKINDNF